MITIGVGLIAQQHHLKVEKICIGTILTKYVLKIVLQPNHMAIPLTENAIANVLVPDLDQILLT